MTLAETAGIGFEIREIEVQLDTPVTFSRQLLESIGSTRVPGDGNLAIPLSIGLTSNGLVAEVVVRGTDDSGNELEAVGRLVVIPAQGP